MEYIVAENDTLSAIASKYNVSAERILRLNNLRSAEDLRTGMVLVIDNLPQQNKAWEDTLPQCDSCQKAEQLKAQGRANIPGADFDAGFNQPAENDGIIYWPPGDNNIDPNYPPRPNRPPYYVPIYNQVQFIEPELNGLNYAWEEADNFRYILTTNKYRYREGERVLITFRKRNLSDKTVVLRYPSGQLFDFYVSDQNGNELWRWSNTRNFSNVMREIVLSPKQAETTNIVWDQRTTNGYWIPAQRLTLWGVNTATEVSIPLEIVIY